MINALSLLTKVFTDVIILANKWILIVIPIMKKGGENMLEIFNSLLSTILFIGNMCKQLIINVPFLGFVLIAPIVTGIFKFINHKVNKYI